MTPAKKLLAVLIVSSLGLWGCAQGPTNAPGSAERIRALETKLAKLEDDFRAASAARDQFRKKIATLEEQRDQQGQELQVTAKDRDELKGQLTARTTERDSVQAQYEQFRKSIKSLIGQAETTLSNANAPAAGPVVETASTAKP